MMHLLDALAEGRGFAHTKVTKGWHEYLFIFSAKDNKADVIVRARGQFLCRREARPEEYEGRLWEPGA